MVPQILEPRTREPEQSFRRLQLSKQVSEFAFERFAPNGLAVAQAAALETQVIAVLLAATLRPACGHDVAAIAATNSAAQREISVEVFACGSLRGAVQALLDFLKALIADESFVIALAQGDAPERRFDHPGIKGIGQNVVNFLRPHFAFPVPGKLRDGLEVPLHFGLRCKLTASETLHCILNDRGERLVTHDDVAPVPGLLELVANGNEKRVIAALDPRLHLLKRLALVLNPLQLALRSDHGFDELAFRRVLEFEVEAFRFCTVLGKLGAKTDMKLRIPREALQVIEDDDIAGVRIVPQVLEQSRHAGALHEIACRALYVAEHLCDNVSASYGIFAASVLLRAAPVPVQILPDAGDPCI